MAGAKRDYSLVGAEARLAQERGLASATWYASPIPRRQMKELMRREDGPAIRDTLIWFACIIGTGAAGVALSGTWWAVPVFFVYGALTCSASDSRWHECGHGTAFRTSWMNVAVYHIACFWVLRQPTVWRWSHARHHTDTIIVGRDPEIAVPRPPGFVSILLNVFAIRSGLRELRSMVVHVFGRLTPEEATFIPEMERPKVYRDARIWAGVFGTVIAISLWQWSLLPLMLIGLPSFYGAWMYLMFGLTQHAGLAEDVLDHRLNARTVYMNPIFRFLYWNMNYHVEHHMFPMVPYHALPKLHAAMKSDTPEPYRGVIAAYREIIPALLRQRRDPGYYVRRKLPPTARPFADFQQLATAAE
jgi:fatty acid desaturase